MRRILVENARRRRGVKHGGACRRVNLDEALSRLAEAEPAKAELVKLRYFAGMTLPEAAAVLGISLATAERYWTYARAWLHQQMAGGAEPG